MKAMGRIDVWAAGLDRRLAGKWGRLYVLAGAALPFVPLVILLVVYAVNVPFWDQWELVPLLQKHQAGTLGFGDFFAQHNEHRLLFPRLIMMAWALVSGWNIYWELATSVVLAAIGLFFLYKLLTRTIVRPWLRLLLLFGVSLIWFSPLQQENWLWGWQIQWYLCVLGLVVAVWALAAWEAEPWRRAIIAALAAVVATFSLASGMFVWLVCAPLLWHKRPLRRWLPIWLGLMAVAVVVYYAGYIDPSGHPSKTLFFAQPLQFAEYILIYLAHPLTPEFWLSLPMAGLYLAALAAGLAFVFKRHRQELSTTLLPWLCLGVYAWLAAASTGISRLGFGLEQAYSSRYTTLAQLLLVAFVVMACKIIELANTSKDVLEIWAKRGAVVALAACMLLISLNYAKGALQMRAQSGHLQAAKRCAQQAVNPNDPCLLILYPNQAIAWRRLQYLREQHLGGL